MAYSSTPPISKRIGRGQTVEYHWEADPGWSGFDSLIKYLQKSWQGEVIEAVDWVYSRRWVVRVRGVPVAVIHDSHLGNSFLREDGVNDQALLEAIEQDLLARLGGLDHQAESSGPGSAMNFAQIDLVLCTWASKNQVSFATHYRDVEVRSIELVGPNGRAQVWVEVNELVTVHVWDYLKRRQSFEADDANLAARLDAALMTARSWVEAVRRQQ